MIDERNLLRAVKELGPVTAVVSRSNSGNAPPQLWKASDPTTSEEHMEWMDWLAKHIPRQDNKPPHEGSLFNVVRYCLDKDYVYGQANDLSGMRSVVLSGLSKEGNRHLRRMESPKKAWMRENWFALAVLAVTTMVNLVTVLV